MVKLVTIFGASTIQVHFEDPRICTFTGTVEKKKAQYGIKSSVMLLTLSVIHAETVKNWDMWLIVNFYLEGFDKKKELWKKLIPNVIFTLK